MQKGPDVPLRPSLSIAFQTTLNKILVTYSYVQLNLSITI